MEVLRKYECLLNVSFPFFLTVQIYWGEGERQSSFSSLCREDGIACLSRRWIVPSLHATRRIDHERSNTGVYLSYHEQTQI